MKLNNTTYDILKKIALYVLPALATLILTLGNIWGFNFSEQVAATITALDTFIGALLGFSSKVYWDNVESEGALDPKEEGVD